MAKEVTLPKLGQSMQEGTLLRMRVQIGDAVAPGDVLYEIETDKATVEVESADSGFVRAILVEAGHTVPVDMPMLILGEADEDISVCLQRLRQNTATVCCSDSLKQSPSRVQMIARDLGVDLSTATPSEAIRTLEADLRQAASKKARPMSAYKLGQKLVLTHLQKVIAEKMVYSKQNIPCFYLNVRVDMTAAIALRGELNGSGEETISFNDIILRALALSIEHYPIMTGTLAGDYIWLADRIDIGLAVSTDDGLVAPIVKDCGSKTLWQISRACKELTERTQSGTLTLEDLEGGCMTVSNLGGFGVDSFIPIVVPGQTSILGLGAIQDTVLPGDKEPQVRKMMNMTLSVDHKVVNGAEAAQFLDYVKKMLEHPSELT
ncbi:MAG: 2-oxo acid dehydrogenase subunit E2 [Phycisphaerae bacterium]|nr:2-oxo acid dehydrogenase subunit E2 [Phycisphaerae bacterium]